jgi:hypothetical protein
VSHIHRLVIVALVSAAAGAFAARRTDPHFRAHLIGGRDVQSSSGFVNIDQKKKKRAQVRTKIKTAGRGTYVHEILQQSDSALARWPDRTTIPIPVWIQDGSTVPDWWEDAPRVTWAAFGEWEGAGIPLRFVQEPDSSRAVIRILWTDRFDEEITGRTTWAHNRSWWITDAVVTLALHHPDGSKLDKLSMRAIALHEIGHLLGLTHTSDAENIMASTVRVSHLSAADRATVRLLYQLPPGAVHD